MLRVPGRDRCVRSFATSRRGLAARTQLGWKAHSLADRKVRWLGWRCRACRQIETKGSLAGHQKAVGRSA